MSGLNNLKRLARSNTADRLLPETEADAEFMALDGRRMNVSGSISGVQSPSGPAMTTLGRVLKAHVLDWCFILAFAITGLVCETALKPREVFLRPLDLDDLRYPLLPNSLPAWSVPVIGTLCPLVAIASTHFIAGSERSLQTLHAAVLGLLNANAITWTITDVIKSLRPDFLERCLPQLKPDGSIKWHDVGYLTCTGDPKNVAQGRKSFPSGHASWAAAGLGFLALFLAGRLRLYAAHSANGGGPGASAAFAGAKLAAVLAPLLVVAIVAVSRLRDYWHHPTDVIAGAGLGFLIASASYFSVFPGLASDRSHVALALHHVPSVTSLSGYARAPEGEEPAEP